LYKNMKLVSGDLHKYILSCALYNDKIMECINEHSDITEKAYPVGSGPTIAGDSGSAS